MIWVTHIEHATYLEICNRSPPSLVTKGYIPAGAENGIANPTVLPSNGFAGPAKN